MKEKEKKKKVVISGREYYKDMDLNETISPDFGKNDCYSQEMYERLGIREKGKDKDGNDIKK